MSAVQQLGPELGIVGTCAALGLARATFYRRRQSASVHLAAAAPPHARELPVGRAPGACSTSLHEPRFVDLAPAEVYATLLDEGRYLCSERTMYRILDGESRGARAARPAPAPELHRARAARHRAQPALELGHHQAARPGEVDVLLPVRDPRRLQPLRRRLDGAHEENGGARREAHRGDVRAPGHRARPAHAPRRPRHVDDARKPVALLLADLGVTKTPLAAPRLRTTTPSRRRTSRRSSTGPTSPSASAASSTRASVCGDFFPWYNARASPRRPRPAHARAMSTTASRPSPRAQRAAVLDAAHLAHPERFVARRANATATRRRPSGSIGQTPRRPGHRRAHA